MRILAQGLPKGRVAPVAAELRPGSFQSLLLHPFVPFQEPQGGSSENTQGQALKSQQGHTGVTGGL